MSHLAPFLLLAASVFTNQEISKELVVQIGQPGVEFHPRPDGSLIAASGAGGIELWDSRGRLLRTITHVGAVRDLDLNPIYDLMVYEDTLIDLHGNPIRELRGTRVHEGETQTYHLGGQGNTWSPDGEVLAVETTSSFVLFDRAGEMLASVPRHLDTLCFSPSSQEVYGVVGRNRPGQLSVHVWNLRGEELRSFPVGEGASVRSMAISKDGQFLAVTLQRLRNATSGEAPLARLFTDTGTWIRDLRTGIGNAGAVLAAGDGGFLYTDGNDTQRWSAEGELLGVIPGFYATACTNEILIGRAVGSNPRARKGRFVYQFLDNAGRLLHQLPVLETKLCAVATSPVADILASLDSGGLIRVWEMSGETLSTFTPMDPAGKPILGSRNWNPFGFAKDGKSLVVHLRETNPDHEYLLRYSLSGKLLDRKLLLYGERSTPEFTAKWLGEGKTLPGLHSVSLPGGVNALDFGRNSRVRRLGDPSGRTIEWGLGYAGHKPSIVISSDGRRLFHLDGRKLRIHDGRTGKLISTTEVHFNANQLAVSPDGKYLAYTGANERDGTITLLDSTGKLLKELAHPGVRSSVGIRGPFFTHDGRGIVTGGTNGSVRIWLWQSDVAINWIFRGDQWIMYTDEGLFDGSRGGGQMLGMTLGNQSFTVDQFALAYNRPDLILELLGTQDAAGQSVPEVENAADGGRGLSVIPSGSARRIQTRTRIEHYRAQFKKRLRKAGLTEADLTAPLHAPTVTAKLLKVENGVAHLRVEGQDTLYALAQLYSWVNGVPGAGRSLQDKEFDGELEVNLSVGENRIEVSVLNNQGVESLRVLVDVMHEATVSPALHVVALGVSDYLDDALDLAFAHKDAQDLASDLMKREVGR